MRKGTQTVCGVCRGVKHRYPNGTFRCPAGKVRQQKEWRKTTKGKIYSKRQGTSLNHKYSARKHIANKYEIEFSISKEQFQQLHGAPCFYCGFDLPKYGYGLDRKNAKVGYSLENLAACCNACNKAKLNLFSSEEMQLIGAAIRQVKLIRLMMAVATEGT